MKNQLGNEIMPVKNMLRVRKLIKQLTTLDMLQPSYNAPSTPEMIVIEKELQKRGIMYGDGGYCTNLPESLLNFIDKVLD